jgi:hypothetical protein
MQDDAKKNKITVAIKTTSYLWAPVRDVMPLSYWGCDAAFLPGAIVIAVLRPTSSRSRSRARSLRSRSRAMSLKSRSRPWGRRGRGWGLGHRDRGHHLEAEVGKVEAARSVRSRSRSTLPRSRSLPWGWGRWGWGREVGEDEGKVTALRLKSARSKPRVRGWGRGLGRQGRGHRLEAEATEVCEDDGEGQVGEVEGLDLRGEFSDLRRVVGI